MFAYLTFDFVSFSPKRLATFPTLLYLEFKGHNVRHRRSDTGNQTYCHNPIGIYFAAFTEWKVETDEKGRGRTNKTTIVIEN